MSWVKELFSTEKPIIAMCHVRALPGDPYFDEEKGMDWVVERAREDFLALQAVSYTHLNRHLAGRGQAEPLPQRAGADQTDGQCPGRDLSPQRQALRRLFLKPAFQKPHLHHPFRRQQ